MQPLYFIPDAQVVTQPLLCEHGLWSLVGANNTSLQTFSGPGGVTGIVIAAGEPSPDYMTPADGKQTWSKRHGYTSLVGTLDDPALRPTESEMRRDRTLPGDAVTLLDGAAWTIPTLRRWLPHQIARWTPALPRVLQQDDDSGKWVYGDILPEYSAVWETSLAVAEQMIHGEPDYEMQVSFAAQLLGINYRVDKSVITHLRLFTMENVRDIIRSALDWSTLEDQIKKEHGRRSGGTNSECGATPPTEASSTATAQP